ncbi:hypothetical protein LEMLEM_LOCUS4850, partial [Lemmus lemmus]
LFSFLKFCSLLYLPALLRNPRIPTLAHRKEEMSSKLRGVRETFLATKPFAGIYNFKTLQVSSTEVSG